MLVPELICVKGKDSVGMVDIADVRTISPPMSTMSTMSTRPHQRNPASLPAQYPLIKLDVLRNNLMRSVTLNRRSPRPFSHLAAQFRISQEAHHVTGHLIDVANRTQVSGLAVVDDFRQPAHARCDNRYLYGHRFERSQSERFLFRR